MEIKNKVRTFCGCNPEKNVYPHKNYAGSYKKAYKHWIKFKIHGISKGRKVNRLWQKIFDQH